MLEGEVKALKTLPLFEDGILKDWIHKGITIDRLHRWNRNNISAWNMKRLMNIVRSSMLSTLDERIKEAGSAGEDEAKDEVKALKTLPLFEYGSEEKGSANKFLRIGFVSVSSDDPSSSRSNSQPAQTTTISPGDTTGHPCTPASPSLPKNPTLSSLESPAILPLSLHPSALTQPSPVNFQSWKASLSISAPSLAVPLTSDHPQTSCLVYATLQPPQIAFCRSLESHSPSISSIGSDQPHSSITPVPDPSNPLFLPSRPPATSIFIPAPP
ncbi:hypothetical protein C2S53_006229 [Perilla frutescens var. hirtella]|uniref:Uncharacterized protein n=1 Tax=Perilla frutescens var. hirtella TaxID=608512 RepID=A0AAD4ITP6_PERFH|nr:hypothetical protein C2S53_006229 [Perilla frutescens var. hirtella]